MTTNDNPIPHRVTLDGIPSESVAEDLAKRLRDDGVEDVGMVVAYEKGVGGWTLTLSRCLSIDIAESMAERFRRGGADAFGMTVTVEPEQEDVA